MFSNLIEDSRSMILRYFPERQIYLRSGGEVSYHSLSTRLQVGIVSGLGVMVGWCLLTLFTALWGQNPLHAPSKQNRLLKAEYERLLEDAEARYENARVQLTQQEELFERATRDFEQKHAAIAQFVKQPFLLDQNTPVAIEKYAGAQVQMAPTVREAFQRKARKPFEKFAELNSGTSLDQPMDNLGRTQNALLISAETAAVDKVEQNRSIIQATNLSIDRILGAGGQGMGGPLVDVAGLDIPEGAKSDPRIVHIQARTQEAKILEDAITAMPLGHPVAAENYQTSSFGMRKDPFTKRPARHDAIDLASYRMAPIVATANGTIKFVGRKGGYGRIVEIDHGYGFVTRYAHLAKTYVKRGQVVKQGDKVGGMGSTGRSTSTHLHYEIRFEGRAYDPSKFLKAGQYVQQN